MSQYYLFQDTKNCIGCHSCEIACKSNKTLPVGPKPCQVIHVAPKMVNGLPRASYVFMPASTAKTPGAWPPAPPAPCASGPGRHRLRRAQPVRGLQDLRHRLPVGRPQWNPETGKVVKCDYCKDRVDAGLKPACATICTTHCLHFGKVEEMTQIRRERHAKVIASLENQIG